MAPRPSAIAIHRTALSAIASRLAAYAPLLAVTVQLGLLLFAMYWYRIGEESGLVHVLPVIFAGFVVHSVLPLRFRAPFFVMLSLGALAMTLGLTYSAYLIGIGLALIGVCHLRISVMARTAILLAAGGVLAAIRVNLVTLPDGAFATLVLPLLGAMFMFRLMIYLYDVRNETGPVSLWQRLSYFFMLPNLYFLLFPVIDYQTFRRTYYDTEATAIYQKGILWMFRGLIHLLLYRLVYYEFLPSVQMVVDLAGVVQYMVATYALYLRISGLFHLIIGIMCLYGYNLPETHHLYFLASSFNDYWRRINIYWKDFMMKIFYYPVYMRLRGVGVVGGIIITTAIVFVFTWALHSYQWFWLRGTFPVNTTDVLFWSIFGLLVIGNAVLEATRGRKRTRVSLGKKDVSWGEALTRSGKVLGTFLTIMTLWTLWSSRSATEFLSVMGVAGASSLKGWAVLAGVLALLVLIGTVYNYVIGRVKTPFSIIHLPFRVSVVYVSAGLAILLAVRMPAVFEALPSGSRAYLAALGRTGLNEDDQEMKRRGYYEGLLNTEKYVSALWATKDEEPEGWRSLSTVTRTDNMLHRELTPSSSDPFYRGSSVITNQWGMRDREYSKAKPQGVFRIALVGASHAFGAGVEKENTFEHILEERLNEEYGSQQSFEILNFAMPGYGLPQQAFVVSKKVAQFEPDMIMYVAHEHELSWTSIRVTRFVEHSTNIPPEFADLNRILQESGASADMDEASILRTIDPHITDLVKWGYAEIIRVAQEQNAKPVWIGLPFIYDGSEEKMADLEALARDQGFVTLNLWGVYDKYDKSTLQTAPWDDHPNELGHKLVSSRLIESIGALGIEGINGNEESLHSAVFTSNPEN